MDISEIRNSGRFTPSAQQVIERAQQKAAQMQAPEAYPEHLLLGILTQGDDEVANVMSTLGMNIRRLREQAASIINSNLDEDTDVSTISLSQEAQACLDWALSFAEQRNTLPLNSASILLSAIRHQRLQPLLVLLLSSEEVLPAYIEEKTGLAYTHAMDQLIQARLSKRSNNGPTLTKADIMVERPTITFADITGAETTKQELHDTIMLLRLPELAQRSAEDAAYGIPHGVLLIGHPCTERTLLIRATAGEAVVPLISLSLAALVDVLSGTDKNEAIQEDRRTLREAFGQAKRIAPSLLFLDDLDALEQLETMNERKALLNQLLVEMDELDQFPPVVTIATTYKPETLEPALILPGRFERQVTLSGSFAAHPAANTKLCLSCKREILSVWKYCIYCGASVLKTCPNCGAPHIEVEGARYCFECGSARWSEVITPLSASPGLAAKQNT
jgi:ATP-dependent 26S proteasome regulatory subunit